MMRLDCVEDEDGNWIIIDCEISPEAVLAKAGSPEIAWCIAANELANRINKIHTVSMGV